jgi:hypothetical protein
MSCPSPPRPLPSPLWVRPGRWPQHRKGGRGGGGGRGGHAGPAAPGGDIAAVDPSVIRGIYELEDETDPDFRAVPKFEDAEGSKRFYSGPRIRVTNPQPWKYSQCTHIYTTLVDWWQVNRFLMEKAEAYRRRWVWL